MRRFYGLLRISYGEPQDVAEAARREVDWWRVHRERQHAADRLDGDDELVESLVRLYTFLYGEPEAAVRPAAVYRTEAMDLFGSVGKPGLPAGQPAARPGARGPGPVLRGAAGGRAPLNRSASRSPLVPGPLPSAPLRPGY